MTVHAPDVVAHDPADLSAPRASVRSSGDSGFIFFNNYVRGYSMPARPAAQFLIRLPDGTLAVPRHPVDMPSGAYFIWPFNLRMEASRSVTAPRNCLRALKTPAPPPSISKLCQESRRNLPSTRQPSAP